MCTVNSSGVMNCYIMFKDMNVYVIQSNVDLVPVFCLMFRYNNGADWLVSYWVIQHTCSYVIKQNATVHQIVGIYGTCVPYCYVTASYKLTFDAAYCKIGLLVYKHASRLEFENLLMGQHETHFVFILWY